MTEPTQGDWRIATYGTGRYADYAILATGEQREDCYRVATIGEFGTQADRLRCARLIAAARGWLEAFQQVKSLAIGALGAHDEHRPLDAYGNLTRITQIAEAAIREAKEPTND